MGTRKGGVTSSTPIGRKERSKWLFEREEFDGGAFWYLNTNVSFEGNHGARGREDGVGREKKAMQRTVINEAIYGRCFLKACECGDVKKVRREGCAHTLPLASRSRQASEWPVIQSCVRREVRHPGREIRDIGYVDFQKWDDVASFHASFQSSISGLCIPRFF